MLELEIPITEQSTDMPSLNHSYLCSWILRQLFQYPAVEALTELTIDVDKGLTPDISVYPAGVLRPNFSRDITRMPDLPLLAIEVISASQNIQDLLEISKVLVNHNIKPCGRLSRSPTPSLSRPQRASKNSPARSFKAKAFK